MKLLPFVLVLASLNLYAQTPLTIEVSPGAPNSSLNNTVNSTVNTKPIIDLNSAPSVNSETTAGDSPEVVGNTSMMPTPKPRKRRECLESWSLDKCLDYQTKLSELRTTRREQKQRLRDLESAHSELQERKTKARTSKDMRALEERATDILNQRAALKRDNELFKRRLDQFKEMYRE